VLDLASVHRLIQRQDRGARNAERQLDAFAFHDADRRFGCGHFCHFCFLDVFQHEIMIHLDEQSNTNHGDACLMTAGTLAKQANAG
jgi:hypothetical protein